MDPNAPGAGSAPVAAAPAPDGATTQAADAGQGKTYGEDHVKQLIRERDEAKAALRAFTPAPVERKKAPPASEYEDLRAELELKDAIADMAPHLTRKQRNAMRDLFKVQRPSSDGLEAWIADTAGVFGRTPEAAQPAKSEPVPVVNAAAAAPRTGSLGAPVAATEPRPTNVSDSVRTGQWAHLTREQRDQMVASEARPSGSIAARFAQRGAKR
jgi:hypothetical protein